MRLEQLESQLDTPSSFLSIGSRIRSVSGPIILAATQLFSDAPVVQAQQPLIAIERSESVDPTSSNEQLRELLKDEFYKNRDRAQEILSQRIEAGDGGKQWDEFIQIGIESNDPEVQTRANILRKELKIKQLWMGSRLDLDEHSVPASEVIQKIAERTGNRLFLGDQYSNFKDADVDLSVKSATYWETMDIVCRQIGHRMRPSYDNGDQGMTLFHAAPGKNPIAYNGPIRAQINSAKRAFSEDIDHEENKSEKTDRFQFDLQMQWEKGFRVIAHRRIPEVVSAVTNAKEEIHGKKNKELKGMERSALTDWTIASSNSSRLVCMHSRLQPPTVDATSLETLQLKWGVYAVGDMRTVNITDFKKGSEQYKDDATIVVEELETGPKSRVSLKVSINRNLPAPETQEMLVEENSITVLDAQGRPFKAKGHENSVDADGTVHVTLRLEGVEEDSAPTCIRIEYPGIRSYKDVIMTFHDVPLPHGRPE